MVVHPCRQRRKDRQRRKERSDDMDVAIGVDAHKDELAVAAVPGRVSFGCSSSSVNLSFKYRSPARSPF
jgi:hypothetical protein